MFVTEARSLVPALAAELKQAAEENARLRSQLADVAQALRAEKALSRLLSAEQEKTGDILGWRDGESTSEAATRLREKSA